MYSRGPYPMFSKERYLPYQFYFPCLCEPATINRLFDLDFISSRLNVLVQAEKVVWIVFVFDACQSVIIDPI